MDPEALTGAVLVALAVPSLAVLALAYRRTRNPRLLLGALAFLMFAVKGAAVAGLESQDQTAPEIAELLADAAGLALFLGALALPRRLIADGR